jgi:formate C-acetyltransferase
VTFTDLSLDNCTRTERVERLRKAYFDACPEICVERPQLITRLHRELGLFDKKRLSILDKAHVYRRILEERKPIVWHTHAQNNDGSVFSFAGDSLFAGSTTTALKGVVLYPEFLALALWPELQTMSQRPANPYKISPEDAKILNDEAFPPWLDRSIMEWTRTETKNSDSPPNFTMYQQMVFFLATKTNTVSHTIPDFSIAVRQGLRAMIKDAQARRKTAAMIAQREFYDAVTEVLEGIIAYSNRLANEAEAMARREPDPRRRTELETLARIHRRVPELPAGTFREALTTIWMCWVAIHLENSNNAMSLGRLDQLLYDLYRRDIESGALTVQDAVELCCCFWLKIGDHVPAVPEAAEQLFGGTGSNQAITIGGVDENGHDAVNDLTYVMLRAIELMRLRDPNLNARYMPGVNSPDYLRRLCLANVLTGATPALHNDKAVIEALTAHGDTLEQARDYGIVGCVEPCSSGRHYGHTGAALLNLTAVLELTLFNGRHRHTGLDRLISIETGDPRSFRSFEDFRNAFEAQLRWMAGQIVNMNNALGRTHQAIYPTPILSAFFEGPMDKGKDLINGGAVINSSGVTIIGLADTADSLSAIQTVVFHDHALPFAEMLKAIEHNFEGHDALQTRLMNPEKTPKWGNENPLADGNVEWIVALLDRVFSSHENYRGGSYRVGYWTMTNHAGYGRLMGALPSGRREKENFTSGFTPVSGVTPYLTPALNSVAAIPARHLSSGVAFNLKFTPETAATQEQMLDRFAASVEAYFRGKDGETGGMEIQFNITRREDFVEAMKHPEKHPELLVRVSGYTAYFKDLNQKMQTEILERTEYELSTGAATTPQPVRLT